MTDLRDLCARMADELDRYRQYLMDDRSEVHALAAEARAALAEPEYPSDKTMRRIRSTTKRWKLSLIITTNDSAIDTRLGLAIWKVLDTENEILERMSIPTLLSSPDAQ